MRFPVLVLHVDEGPRELDERFVEIADLPLGPEPDMLQHIVSLVILAGVEEPEIFQIARVVSRVAAIVTSSKSRGDLCVLS